MTKLQEKGMLVHLQIRQWSGRKHDKTASTFVSNSYNSDINATRVNKLLVPKALLKELEQIVAKSRTYFASNTLPWMDNGTRILPTDKYFDFISGIGTYKNQFEDSANKLQQNYSDFLMNIQEQHAHLGKLFDITEYPPAEDILSRFTFETTFAPIPDVTDWRFGNDTLKEELEEALKKQLIQTEITIKQDITSRVFSKLIHIKEILSAGSKFQNRTFDNLDLLADLIPSLNILNDPRITEITNELRVIAAADTKVIREDDHYKQDVIDQTTNILNKIENLNVNNFANEDDQRQNISSSEQPLFRDFSAQT